MRVMPYAFEGEVIKLNERDYHAWKSLFSHLDLDQQLRRLDLEFSHEGIARWFTAASAKLNYLNDRADVRSRVKHRFGF